MYEIQITVAFRREVIIHLLSKFRVPNYGLGQTDSKTLSSTRAHVNDSKLTSKLLTGTNARVGKF